MKKTTIVFSLLVLATAITGCGRQFPENAIQTDPSDAPALTQAGGADGNQPMSYADAPADRLEIYYFHRSARCTSCTAVEAYVREVVDSRFSGEVGSGLIDFRSIDVEAPENLEVARKFKATGSSLYFNQVAGGEDNIEFDADVWRLFGNEAALKKHLEDKIKSLL